jgi:hypothetical protein
LFEVYNHRYISDFSYGFLSTLFLHIPLILQLQDVIAKLFYLNMKAFFELVGYLVLSCVNL